MNHSAAHLKHCKSALFFHVHAHVMPWIVCSSPGSSVHEILQARILEWVAISYSRGSSQPRDKPYIKKKLKYNQSLTHCSWPQGAPILTRFCSRRTSPVPIHTVRPLETKTPISVLPWVAPPPSTTNQTGHSFKRQSYS